VVLWEHGTTGVAQKCAPSILRDPFTAGALFIQEQVLAHGWALVAPDYLGLGASPPHPYLVGVPEARSALDAVRATRQLTSIKLSNQTVVWGHSQGGGAALWTGIEQATDAPDVPLSGVAALAPASDTLSLANGLESSKSGMLFASLMLAGYNNAYPAVSFDAYVRASAQTVVHALTGRCLSSRTSRPPSLASSAIDTRAGERLEYRTYPGLDHVPLVEPNSPLIRTC